ncbi:MAG TPA: VOC family protein, partial [Nitrolancea sp.]|nr:VOC family protein [Nitrolancea sp.]
MEILGVKHLAIAVSDCDAALAQYQRFLGISQDVKPRDLVKGGSREAHFMFGDVQIQLCQSLEENHRFDQFIKEHGEGLHHACLSVDNIEE